MRWFEIAFRLCCAAILAVFSCVALLICYQALRTVVSEPAKMGIASVMVFAGCAALAYFLLLLIYRLATGRGRAADGGLFPPAVVKGLVLWHVYDRLGERAFLATMRLLSAWRNLRGRSHVLDSVPRAEYESVLLIQYREILKGEVKPRTREELRALLEARRSGESR